VAKLTRLKTERSGFIKTRAAILFTFQSRKDDACDRLFSAGQKRNWGSMCALSVIEKEIKE
jgi:hypothetical protein